MQSIKEAVKLISEILELNKEETEQMLRHIDEIGFVNFFEKIDEMMIPESRKVKLRALKQIIHVSGEVTEND